MEIKYWWIYYFLLMPDHVHSLIGVSYESGLEHSIISWKRFTAKSLGIKWQRDFFDHRLRKEESLVGKAEYISMNPVRAGLVSDPTTWPYFWGFNSSGKSIVSAPSPRAPF